VTAYDFAAAADAWSHPPADGIGNPDARIIPSLPDDDLRTLAARIERARYDGMQNYKGLWRSTLGLDDTHDKDVLDFGCGLGVEALQYAKAGNRVMLADISIYNLAAAEAMFRAHGHEPDALVHVQGQPPFFDCECFDIFHASGVLHHTPWARDIVAHALGYLRAGGEVRLMLYSDEAWRLHVGDDPPDDTAAHPAFDAWVRRMDPVGFYADWYDRDKIERTFGDMLELRRFSYLCPNRQYCAAVLVKP